MKAQILFTIACVIVGAQSEFVQTAYPLQYAYGGLGAYPYALQYSHLNPLNPYLFPATRLALLQPSTKHHTPEHTGDGGDENKEQQPQQPTLKYYQPGLFPLTYQVAEPLPLSGSHQYHTQDELGQYQYGYSNEQSAKTELKTFDGITRGSYSYIDSEGKLQSVNYVADGLGFRAAATNLPQQVQAETLPAPIESAEIIEARRAHLKAHDDALELLRKAKDSSSEEPEEKKAE